MQPKLTLLDDELIVRILEEAYELLECPGIKVQNPEARDLLAAAGAKIYPDNQVIGFPAALVRNALESVPREFYLSIGGCCWGGSVVITDWLSFPRSKRWPFESGPFYFSP